MGLSRSERVVLCLLAVAILAGRVVRDRLDGADEIAVFADRAAAGDSSAPIATLARAEVDSVGERVREAVASIRGDGGAGTRRERRGPLDLNAASESELVLLPGIGPAKARAIVEWRAAHGPFARVADLLDVPGIGPKTAGQLEGLIAVDAAQPIEGGSR